MSIGYTIYNFDKILLLPLGIIRQVPSSFKPLRRTGLITEEGVGLNSLAHTIRPLENRFGKIDESLRK